MFDKELDDNSTLAASQKHDYYLLHEGAVNVHNGFTVKLDEKDAEAISDNQRYFLEKNDISKKDLIVKSNSLAVRKYFKEVQKYLKYNYNIKKIWEQQTVSANYEPTPFRYGQAKRDKDTELVLSILKDRWEKRLLKRVNTNNFEGIFKLFFYKKLDAEIGNETFNPVDFLKKYEGRFNDDTKLLSELDEDLLKIDLFAHDEGLYYKLLVKLNNKYIN